MGENKDIIQVDDSLQQQNDKEGMTPKIDGSKSVQVIKKATNVAIKAGKAFVEAPLPPSITWLYGFGFKIGILLVLKSFLVTRYQWANLSQEGFVMLSSQFVLALILISCGLIMQTPGILGEPSKVRTVTGLYFVAGLVASIVSIRAGINNWSYFITSQKVNFFTRFISGAKELSTSIIFIDSDLWAFFAVILFVIAAIFMCTMFGPGALIGRFQKELDDGTRVNKWDFQSLIVTAGAAVIAVAILVGVPQIAFANRVQPTVSAKDFKTFTYEDAEETLKKAGFKNISLEAKYSKNGKDNVQEVSIGGNKSFGDDSYFNKNTDVVVVFQSNYQGVFANTKSISLDDDGQKIDAGCAVDAESWESEDSSIVIVEQDGSLIPVATGKTNVSATVNGIKYSCRVTVKEDVLSSARSLIVDAFGKEIQEIAKDAFNGSKEGVNDIVSKAANEMDNMLEKTKEGVDGVVGDAKDGLGSAIDWVKNIVKK